jgi:protein ImuA
MSDMPALNPGPERQPVATQRIMPASLPDHALAFAAATAPGLHEIYAVASADGAAATGFALGLVRLRLGRCEQPLIWVRQDMLQAEGGHIYPPGLQGFGIAPWLVTCVRARDGLGVLQAGLEASRCAGLAAVLADLWGVVKTYDLTASRRLTLAAKASGTPLFLLRHVAETMPSAADTRWQVRSHRSRKRAANAPGPPAFEVRLLRQRGGRDGQVWCVEWNNERALFEDVSEARNRNAPLPGAVAALPAGGTAGLRRAG